MTTKSGTSNSSASIKLADRTVGVTLARIEVEKMMFVPVPFTCLYHASYIPKRARKPRDGYFHAEGLHLAVNKIERSEAELAFRIHQPQILRRKVVWDVLRHNGQLWWPLSFWNVDFVDCTEEELLDEICSGKEDIFRQRRDWKYRRHFRPYYAIEEMPIRELIHSDFERTFADCKRKASSYLLRCDGMAYVAGGEPMYYLSECGGLYVCAVGADRSADTHASWIYCGLPDSAQDGVRRGHIYPATELSNARSAQPRRYRRRRLPLIEVHRPDAVTTPPVEVQVDALYRDLVSAMNCIDSTVAGPRVSSRDFHNKELELFRDRIIESIGEPPDSPLLTKNRLKILKECQDRKIGGRVLLEYLARFFDRDDVKSILASCLTSEDEDAIASLM